MDKYDLIIIGGGPAGLTAGIYAQRYCLKTLLLEGNLIGGQAIYAEKIENYPGFPDGVSGAELLEKMHLQAQKLGLKIKSEKVTDLLKIEAEKIEVRTASETYQTSAVILATGTQPQKLGLPGEEEFIGKGVSYCATCDAPFFRGQTVAVIGGGDSAVSEALFLTKYCAKVFLVHRREQLRAAPLLVARAKNNPPIEFLLGYRVRQILGQEKVNGLKIDNVQTGTEKTLELSGLFIFIGLKPNTDFLEGLVKRDEPGYVLTGEDLETSVAGIFAGGDCRKRPLRQVVTACGEGALAAKSAFEYLEHKHSS